MKVCAVVPGFLRHGGVSYVARHLAAELSGRDVEIWVLTDDGRDPDVPFEVDRLSGLHTIPIPGLPFPLDVFGFVARAAPVVRRLHQRHGFDLIHAHGHLLLAAGLFDRLRIIDCPLLSSAHGTYLKELAAFGVYPDFPGKLRYKTGVMVDQRILSFGCGRADRIHAVASQTAVELVEMGFDRDIIDVVPNGIDLEEFDTEAIESVRGSTESGAVDSPLIVSVGSIVPRKGVHVLAAAAAQLTGVRPEARVVHVGGVGHPGYAAFVEDLADAADGAMTLVGRVPRRELLGWLEAADVFVSPSFSEGCPIGVLEAAASGTTTVATDVGGTRDILGDEGRYVPVDDAAALVDAIDWGLDHGSRGRSHRRRVEDKFNWSDLTDELLSTYHRTMT